MLVDEFQDTNNLQAPAGEPAGFKRPAERSARSAMTTRASTVVGAGPRSGTAPQVRRGPSGPQALMPPRAELPDARMPLLGAANRLIKNNPRRRGKNLWSPQEGAIVVHVVRAAGRQKGGGICGQRGRRDPAREQTSRGSTSPSPTEWTTAVARAGGEPSAAGAVPTGSLGGKSFFDRREVKDVLATLTCLINPSDDVGLLRKSPTPRRGGSARPLWNSRWSTARKPTRASLKH